MLPLRYPPGPPLTSCGRSGLDADGDGEVTLIEWLEFLGSNHTKKQKSLVDGALGADNWLRHILLSVPSESAGGSCVDCTGI